jgi:hypothetical protein
MIFFNDDKTSTDQQYSNEAILEQLDDFEQVSNSVVRLGQV